MFHPDVIIFALDVALISRINRLNILLRGQISPSHSMANDWLTIVQDVCSRLIVPTIRYTLCFGLISSTTKNVSLRYWPASSEESVWQATSCCYPLALAVRPCEGTLQTQITRPGLIDLFQWRERGASSRSVTHIITPFYGPPPTLKSAGAWSRDAKGRRGNIGRFLGWRFGLVCRITDRFLGWRFGLVC